MPGFFDEPLEEIEHYLTDEMCHHLLSEGIDNVICNGPETLMGEPAYTVFYQQYLVRLELMTDQLANILQQLLVGPKYMALLQALQPPARNAA